MSISTTWNILEIDCLATAPGTNQPNCVYDIHWECVGISTDINPVTNKPYTARTYGSARLQYDANATYIPYENLTHDQVLTWTHNIINQNEDITVGQIEQGVTSMIQGQITPAVIKPALPW
jgi:hypothetical protein